MNLYDLVAKPAGATHYFVASSKVQASGSTCIIVFFFKKVGGEWLRWWAHPDNEYPAWSKVNQIFREGFFESNVLPMLFSLGAKP